jgi:ABC-type transport system involved in cytochrome bd biosynthesis fused ATPase/permease subunit
METESDSQTIKEENKTLKKKLEKLEEIFNSREETRKKFTWWISKTVSILGLIYLIVSIFVPSNTRINKISNTEIFVFAIILIFNSGLIEKLEDFSVDGTKIQAKFKSLQEKQEKQQEEINQLSQAQEIALQFALKGIIDQYEVKHLQHLRDAEDNNSEHIVKYGGYIKSTEEEIRHLIALKFLYKKANISALINELKSNQKADLRKYVNVTPDGRKYLSLRKQLGIEDAEAERAVSDD